MSREKGTFNFAANFELLKKGPLDARMVVGTYADLTTPATWEDGDSLVWLYDGAIVAVSNDGDTSKNGLYFLNDADNYTLTASWDQLGSSSGSTLNAVENIGSGSGVYSGVSGTTILLRSIVGSGNTDVSISGDSLVVHSIDSTALQNGILKFEDAQQTFQPYPDLSTNLTFYTGSTSPTGVTYLNLNASLGVTELRLSTGSTHVSHDVGDIFWDNDDSTVSIQQTSDVIQQVGQELYVKVINKSGGLISNGDVVYISGSSGGRAAIAKARASDIDGDIVDEVIGMATEDILNDGEGFVTTSGIVRDLNTTGFTEGDIVYVSEVNWGGITDVKPTYPDFAVEVGIVTNVSATEGRVLIRVNNVSTTQQNVRGIQVVNPPVAGWTASTRSDVISIVGNAGFIYLPAAPQTGQQITVMDHDGDALSWNITIDGNGKNINADTQAIINTDWGSMTFIYNGTRWIANVITA